jgi:hypothetical protein
MIPVTKTVSEWLKSKSITPMMLTVNIDSAASVALRHAGYELFRTDPDNEAEYARAADAYEEAERVFLDIHGSTEVTRQVEVAA